jgi:hypothetical protein
MVPVCGIARLLPPSHRNSRSINTFGTIRHSRENG